MDRKEHLEWSKKRALRYCDAGDPHQAMTSMLSDLRKHPELKDHAALELGMMLMFGGQLSTPAKARDFIEGFN